MHRKIPFKDMLVSMLISSDHTWRVKIDGLAAVYK